MTDLNLIHSDDECVLYELQNGPSKIRRFIASTPETRDICNDPFLFGVRYTEALRTACARVFRASRGELPVRLDESYTTVLNILRGGLNFGLREALAEAFNWNRHSSAFISAQRARAENHPDDWYITENSYQKVSLPKHTTIVFGDVVATGTSLGFALHEILKIAESNGSQVDGLVFFTIGGERAEQILAETDAKCRELFPAYRGSAVIYFEGRFAVAQEDTPMAIKISGTDLLRTNSILAPEFFQSQYQDPAFPLERCTIYDAGSRSFWLPEYLEDLQDYWNATLNLAERGLTFEALLKERFPELEFKRFGKTSLKEIALRQLGKIARFE